MYGYMLYVQQAVCCCAKQYTAHTALSVFYPVVGIFGVISKERVTSKRVNQPVVVEKRESAGARAGMSCCIVRQLERSLHILHYVFSHFADKRYCCTVRSPSYGTWNLLYCFAKALLISISSLTTCRRAGVQC